MTTTSVYTSAEVFANNKAGCDITTCTLKATGCSNALVPPFDTLITIDAASPWAIKISQT